MSIPYMPGWGDALKNALPGIGDSIGKIINPHQEEQQLFRNNLLNNPELQQKYATLLQDSPELFDNLNLGKRNRALLSNVNESQEAKNARSMNVGISQILADPDSLRLIAQNQSGLLPAQQAGANVEGTKANTEGIIAGTEATRQGMKFDAEMQPLRVTNAEQTNEINKRKIDNTRRFEEIAGRLGGTPGIAKGIFDGSIDARDLEAIADTSAWPVVQTYLQAQLQQQEMSLRMAMAQNQQPRQDQLTTTQAFKLLTESGMGSRGGYEALISSPQAKVVAERLIADPSQMDKIAKTPEDKAMYDDLVRSYIGTKKIEASSNESAIGALNTKLQKILTDMSKVREGNEEARNAMVVSLNNIFGQMESLGGPSVRATIDRRRFRKDKVKFLSSGKEIEPENISAIMGVNNDWASMLGAWNGKQPYLGGNSRQAYLNETAEGLKTGQVTMQELMDSGMFTPEEINLLGRKINK